MTKVKRGYDSKKHNFNKMISIVKQLFGQKLMAILIHGSLFDGTLGSYSDYDIVVIANDLPDDVLVRDQYAQKLKKQLTNDWTTNPFSFDFYTPEEFADSVKKGHPFTKSILTKGYSVYDPEDIFEKNIKNRNKTIQPEVRQTMFDNLCFLAERYIEQAKITSDLKQYQFAIMLASDAIALFAMSKLIGIGHNIYQGEIYQFFIKEFSSKLSDKIKTDFWDFVFPAAQITFRFKQPHVDVPLQDVSAIFDRIDKRLVGKLINFYDELKNCFK